MKLELSLLCGLLCCAGCGIYACQSPPPHDVPTSSSATAFVDVRVFDGAAMLEHQTVVVEGSRIVAAGAAAAVSVPEGAMRFQGADYTLLPGFIDTHVHIEFYDPARVVKGGITTARDLGWPPDAILPLAQSLNGSPLMGPGLLVAGPILTAPGGYPTDAGWAPPGTGLEVASAEAARTAVRDLVSRGVSVIKVAQQPGGPTLPLETLQAIVAEAHAAGLKVSSHCASLQQLELALQAGIDDLAHELWSNESIPQDVIVRMVGQGMTVAPTLHVAASEERIDNLRRFAAAGGRVIYGTDMGNFGPPPGIDTVELELMEQAGMSALQVMAAGTSVAADYLGLSDRGRVGVGKAADLVLVSGDPVADISILAKPLVVMRAGMPVP